MAEFDVGAKVNDATINKAIKSLDNIKKAQARLAKEVLEGKVAFDANEKQQKSLSRAQKVLEKNLDRVNKSWRVQTDDIDEATLAVQRFDNRLKELNDEFDRTSQQVGAFGDIQSNIGAIGGLAGAAGAGGVATGLGIAGEASALLEELPRLKKAFGAGGLAIQATTKAIGLGGLAGGFQTLFPALGATGVSIAAITAVAAPLIVAGAALAIGFNALRKEQEQAAEAIKAAAEARQIQADVERDIARQLAEGDVAGAIQARNEAFETSADLAEDLARELDILAGIDTFGIDAWNSKLQAQQEIVDELTQQSALANIELAAAEEAIAGITEAEREQIRNADALKEQTEQLAMAEQELTQIEAQREQGAAQLARLLEQENQLKERAAQSDMRRLEDEILDEQFAAEDRAQRLQEQQQQLEQIEAQGALRVADIRKQLVDLPIKQQAEIEKAEVKANEKLGKLNQDFFSKTLKETRSFQKESERIEKDTTKKRLRLIQDLNKALSKAELENNVIAFLEAQEQGAQSLARQAQDEDEREKQRLEDFAQKQQEAAAAQRKRLKEEAESIRKNQAEIRANFAEQRAELGKQLDQEKANIELARDAALDSFREQQRREQQSAERQAQRDALTEQRREEDHQAQLMRISEQAQAQQAALNALIQQAGQATQRVGQLGAPSPTRRTFRQSLTRGARGSGLRAFANGGVIRGGNPETVVVGDTPPGIDEEIIPFRRSQGRPSERMGMAGGANSPTVMMNIDMSVGDITTGREVTNKLNDFQIHLGNELNNLFANMLAPTSQ
jgi:hypothetical protein